MPVYLRKNLTITPPSLSELPDEDINDFLQDPAQLRDKLPQPYRMLDKLVTTILDKAFDIISTREKERAAEASRIRPPQYQASIEMQTNGSSNCLCETEDGQYIIAGLPNGLAVIEALSQNVLDTWMEDNMSITQLQVKILKEDQYLICTCDEEGVGRLFCVASGKLFMLQVMNEAQTSGPKVMAKKCEAAQDGCFIGVYFENTSSNESYLELHKPPLETWLKELDSAVAQANKAQTSSPQPHAQPPSQTDPEVPTSPTGEAMDGDPDKSSGTQSPIHSDENVQPRKIGDARNVKFTPANLVIRVRPPAPIQPVVITSPPQLAKDQGDVLGTGTAHLLSSPHLEGRHSWFAHQHQQHMKYLPTDDLPPLRAVSFHFLTPGRMLPQGLENPTLAGSCTSIAVWWTGSHNLTLYSLIKSAKDDDDAGTYGKSHKKSKRIISGDAKDNEDNADDLYRQRSKVSMTPSYKSRAMSHHSSRSRASSTFNDYLRHQEPKPDSVWPMAHAILASAASPCTSLIALALANGSVIVWDKNLGMERRVLHLTEETEIERLEFLDPSVCPQELGNYPPYGTRTNVYLLATCKDSQMFLVECELGKDTTANQVTQAIENKDERYVAIKKVAGIPNMVLACRQDGLVYLINLLGGNVICEITLPENYQLASPCKPVTAVGGLGQMVYLKAKPKNSNKMSDTEISAGDEGKLFVFPLRQYNILNRQRIKERPVIPYTIHSTSQNRVDALLAERLSQQSMRKDRMQSRWGQMKGELEVMLQLRREAATRVSNRDRYVLSSIEKSITREEVETLHPMLI